MGASKNLARRVRSVVFALAIVAAQFSAIPFINTTQVAHAAPLCKTDTAGANDVPNQKDLTQMCVDYSSLPTTLSTTWGWDDLGTNGNNTMDACNLFDTDGDGNANYAVCVTTTGNDPASFGALTTYSCGDDRADRCDSPNAIISNGTTQCSVSQPSNDPFPTGDFSPEDTQGACTIQLSTIGGSAAKLIDVCSYPSGQPNSDPSDCVIAKANSGKLEVVKSLAPNTDTGVFNLTINGTTYATNVGDGGTTGEVVVPETSNQHSNSVGESAGLNTSLAGYTSAIVCKDLNGTGSIVAQGSGTSLTVPVVDGSDIICTITNTRLNGSLTVVKNLIKDNGATQSVTDFGFQVDGGSIVPFEADASNTFSYPSGTVIGSITEPTATGFTTSYDNCTNLTIVAGQTQTCTITNNDIAPSLTVIKHVINDNGGNAASSDFDMQITGTNVSDASFPGAEDPGTTVTLNAGSYSVAESGPGGYGASLSADCAGTIALGQHKTCTITNNDMAPVLTVVKNVINDNGGTSMANAFTLKINGTALTSPVMSNGDLTATYTAANPLAHTAYTVSEDAFTGYTGSAVSCTDDFTHLTVSHPVTLAEGQAVTCTITNNDNTPALTLIKKLVDNYQSGATATDWTLTATGPTTISGTTGVTSGSTFSAGSYTLSESGPTTGFTASTWDCGPNYTVSNATLTIALGDTVICTIMNTAIQPKITLIKAIDGDQYGDTSTVNDFGLTIGGTPATSGVTYGKNVGSYAIDETGKSGYSFVNITGDAKCPSVLGGSVSLALGDDITCTIHNAATAPVLKLKKIAINNNGGTKLSGDFTLDAGSNQYTGGTSEIDPQDSTVTTTTYTTGLRVGSYVLDETEVDGYSASSWSCTSGLDGTTVYVTLGTNITCTITNNDNTPALTLVKNLVNNYSTGVSATDWTLTATGPTTLSGTTGISSGKDFSAGDYTLSEDGQTSGFHASSWNCGEDATLSDATLTIGLGETVICTITNTAIQPKITVIKHVVDSFGGSKTASDFTMYVDGTDVTLMAGNTGLSTQQTFPGNESGTNVYLDAGDYSVDETELPGYTKSLSEDCTGTIALGEEKVCTITNTAVQPKITLVKEFKGGEGNQNDFTPLLNDADATWGVNLVNAGSYSVNEKTPMLDGYKLYSINCYETGSEKELKNPVELNVGDDVTCVVTNEKLGSIVVTKYNDLNRNKIRDNYFGTLEPTVEGVTINLNNDSKVTDASGVVRFTDLTTDEYDLSENLPADWTLTNISCKSDGDYEGYAAGSIHEIRLSSGENVTCEIGNARTDLNIDVVKTNNAVGEKINGDVITYTVTLTNPISSGLLVHPTIMDTPPTGFIYQTNSTTVTSNFRGDLKAQGIVGEPIVSTNLMWRFDGATTNDDVLKPGETITLTYAMKVGQGVTAGQKKNTVVGTACAAPSIVPEDDEINLERATVSLLQVSVPVPVCTSDESSSVVTVKVPEVLVNTGSPIEFGAIVGSIVVLGAMLVSTKRFADR